MDEKNVDGSSMRAPVQNTLEGRDDRSIQLSAELAIRRVDGLVQADLTQRQAHAKSVALKLSTIAIFRGSDDEERRVARRER